MAGGQVIAVDQEGRPALVANTFGRGKALLCAYPLESYLALKPAAFEGSENTHTLYRALRTWAGVTPAFCTDQPSVEVAALVGRGRGYAVLANHQPQPQTVTVSARDALRSAALVTPSGCEPIPLDGRSWKMSLVGYGGAIVEWQA
jgi:beta-glucosidase